MEFWSRLADVRSRWNVLNHSFYQRWSRGELSREELAFYAGQYRHAVVALADASEHARASAGPEARDELQAHADEERAHVALWDEFAEAVGGRIDAQPRRETAACAATWAGGPGRGFERSLAALYAIEAAQPAISETKRAGLLEHYGFHVGAATAYFDLHATRDREHAQAGRALIAERLDHADPDELLAEAEGVLRANWELLDGVEQRFGR